jgi:hypothetical protein
MGDFRENLNGIVDRVKVTQDHGNGVRHGPRLILSSP